MDLALAICFAETGCESGSLRFVDIQSPSVTSLLDDIATGHVVLPNFQREFVWKPEDVKDLLVSVLADFYIGTMLYMDCSRDEAPFSIRIVSGVEDRLGKVKPKSILKILLDGQQRCSSLFYALYQPDLPLYGRKNPVRFVLDVQKALDKSWDDAVVSFDPKNKMQVAKFTGEDYIGFDAFIDQNALIQKLNSNKWANRIPEVFSIINRFTTFKVQMAELKQSTPLDTVIEIFERINRTGMPLDVTDLLVARQFKSGTNLRELIDNSKQTYSFLQEEQGIDPEFVLRTMCLMENQEIKKGNILRLEAKNFGASWERSCGSLETAFRMIMNSQTGFGAIDLRRFMPFRTMIVPLARMLQFADALKGPKKSAYDKISEWYWISVFNNRYNEAVNSITFTDASRMQLWVNDDDKVPDFVSRFNPTSIDFAVSSKSSSTYRGVLCLIIKEGALDFRSGKDPGQDINKLQDDHIFPRSGFSDNSILNRTLISSNAEKGNQQPAKYFSALQTVHGTSELARILKTHLIDDKCLECLLENDLEGFKKARKMAIVEKIRSITPHAVGT